jgi:hypothetical protein
LTSALQAPISIFFISKKQKMKLNNILLSLLIASVSAFMDDDAFSNENLQRSPVNSPTYVSHILYKKVYVGSTEDSNFYSYEPILSEINRARLNEKPAETSEIFGDTPTEYRMIYQETIPGKDYSAVKTVKRDEFNVDSITNDNQLNFFFWEISHVPNVDVIYDGMSQNPKVIEKIMQSGNTQLLNRVPDLLTKAAANANVDLIHEFLKFPNLVDDANSKSLKAGFVFKFEQFAQVFSDILVHLDVDAKHYLMETVPYDSLGEMALILLRKDLLEQYSVFLYDENIVKGFSDSMFNTVLSISFSI